MIELPQKFMERMKKQLPTNELAVFFSCYEQGERYKGIRLNELKISTEDFEKISPYALTPVPWAKNGYYVSEEKVGGHPYHFAGLFYSQEPSAMSPVPCLDVQPNEKVLDLCSAPGGKGTQIAGYMQGQGVLVLNEPVFSRAKILSENVERMGVRNAIVTSAYPKEIAKTFSEYFDKVLVDAPCSGEGMFRKNAKEMQEEWSEENVEMCAERQREILDYAVQTLKVGGKMVYSTCTFALQEDEEQVENLLSRHPELKLIKQEKLYPHKVKGEGHFLAVFEKTDGGENKLKPFKTKISPSSENLYLAFEKSFLKEKLQGKRTEVNQTLYLVPSDFPDTGNLQILRAGIRLGTVENNRFTPEHSLAMCLTESECKNVCKLSLSDERTEKFLHGETVEDTETQNGWCIVTVDGYPVGLGKAVGGTVKNHIPKALRKMG